MVPLGRLYLGILNEPLMTEPLMTYGQWEETLLALRIFIGTWETVEFSFEVTIDTGIGQEVSRIGRGMLVALAISPMPRTPSESEKQQ